MKLPIYVISNNTYLRKSGEYIIVDSGKNKIPCPTNGISYIVKYGNSQISEQLLNYLAEHGIPIFRYSYGGKYNGMFLPSENNMGKSRINQYASYFDQHKRLHIAKRFVKESTLNKIQNLKKYKYKCKNLPIKESIERIESFIERVDTAENLDSLRGYEGALTKEYYSSFFSCQKKYKQPFTREYNPPTSEVNCLLSFGYALLYCEITSKIHEHGLCPFIGFLHETNNQQTALAYDLSEYFKQPFIDGFVLNLINREEVKDFWFNKKEDGSVLLSTPGKQEFLKEWHQFMRCVIGEHSRIESIRSKVISFRDSMIFSNGDMA